jgi:DNA-binding transcriptional regulator GbsR (MarR family)
MVLFLEDFDTIPAILNEPIFQKSFEEAGLAGMTYDERNTYEMSLFYYRDWYAVTETAIEEAVEKELQNTERTLEDTEKALQNAEKGFENKVIEIARKILKRNFSNEDIAEDTGLTIAVIQQLRYELEK